MKRILLFLALCMPPIAHAMQFEAEIGGASFADRGDGFWYQEGFPHRLDLQTPAVSAGFTGDVMRYGRYGLAWHADYVYIGKVHTAALAVADDANYNLTTKGCNGECLPLGRWYGTGFSHGLRLTLEPYVMYRGWRFGVEAGYYISKNYWKMNVQDWQPTFDAIPRELTVYDDGNWRAYPTFGLSIGRENFDVLLRHYRNQSRTDPTTGSPAIWSYTTSLTIRYRF